MLRKKAGEHVGIGGRGRSKPFLGSPYRSLLWGLALAGCWWGCAPATPPDPDVLATWDNGELRIEDLDTYLLSLSPSARFPGEGEDVSDWLAEKVESLFQRRVLLASSDEGLPAAIESVLEVRSRKALSRAYLSLRNEDDTVTKAEAKAFYEQHRGRWNAPEKRSFRHLLRSFASHASEMEKDAICRFTKELRQQVIDGASFEELVRQYSQSSNAAAGGLVGTMTRSNLRGEVGELVFSLEAGEVSPVLRNAAGCQIFLVVQVLPRIETSFELAQEAIVRHLVDERRAAWYLDLLRREAATAGAELPSWLGGPLPPETPLDAVLFELGDEQIMVRDLAPGLRVGISSAQAFQNLLGEILFSAAMEREYSAEAAEIRRAVREVMTWESRRQESLMAFLTEQPEDLLRNHYERHKDQYQSDPRLELTLYSWPIGEGDPLRYLHRPQAFLAAVDEAGGKTEEVWPDFLNDPGVEREAFPQASIRDLAKRFPGLSGFLLEDLVEGTLGGPLRVGRRLYVVQVNVLIPSRQLSFLEVQGQVRSDFIREEGASLEARWLADLAAKNGLKIQRENLAGFGQRLAERLQEGIS